MTRVKPAAVLRHVVELICIVALFAILFYTVANVASRVLVGTPLPAAIELVTRWWMIPLVFGGWILAYHAREHISVDFVVDNGRKPVATVVRVVNHVLLLVFLLVIAYGGWVGATENWLRNEYGIDTGGPVWATRYVVPVLAALFAGYVVHQIWMTLRPAERSDKAGETDAV